MLNVYKVLSVILLILQSVFAPSSGFSLQLLDTCYFYSKYIYMIFFPYFFFNKTYNEALEYF